MSTLDIYSRLSTVILSTLVFFLSTLDFFTLDFYSRLSTFTLDSPLFTLDSRLLLSTFYSRLSTFTLDSRLLDTLGQSVIALQLVWKTSQELGVGVATGKNEDNSDCTYVVTRYKPAGNKFVWKICRNVLKGIFDESFCTDSESRASKAGNAVHNDESGSGSGNGEGSGRFGHGKKWRGIERGNRRKPFWDSASDQGSGSSSIGEEEKNIK